MLKNNQHILYLLWGENIAFKGLIRGQVFELLSSMKTSNPSLKIHLLIGIPLINRNLLTHPRKYFSYMKETKNKLNEDGILMSWTCIPTVSSFFYSNFITIFLYQLYGIFFIRFFLIGKNFKIIHCRSYHSTLLANLVKKIYNPKIKIIFDTRGAFPEEGVFHGFLGKNSFSYYMWKKLEKFMMMNSDHIVFVSSGFLPLYEVVNIFPDKFSVIHTTVNLNNFSPSDKNLQKVNEAIRIIYLGVIDGKSWYSTSKLFYILSLFNKYIGNTNLLIITNNEIKIDHLLNEYSISSDQVAIKSSSTPQETSQLLQTGHFGIFPTITPESQEGQTLLDVLIGAKTGEYLASGLPLITLNQPKGLVDLVLSKNLGMVINENEDNEILFGNLKAQYLNWKINSIQFAEKNFGANIQSLCYNKIYSEISP